VVFLESVHNLHHRGTVPIHDTSRWERLSMEPWELWLGNPTDDDGSAEEEEEEEEEDEEPLQQQEQQQQEVMEEEQDGNEDGAAKAPDGDADSAEDELVRDA
jgi:hypothetical protein